MRFFSSFIKIFAQHENHVVELREHKVSDPESLKLTSLCALKLKFKVSDLFVKNLKIEIFFKAMRYGLLHVLMRAILMNM